MEDLPTEMHGKTRTVYAVLGLLEPAQLPGRSFPAYCVTCGWHGSSYSCGGGTPIADTGDYSELTCPACHAETGDDGEVMKFMDALYRRAKSIVEGTPWPVRGCECCDVEITDFSRWCVTGPLCEVCEKSQSESMEAEGRAFDESLKSREEV